MKFLAISGSARQASTNTALLETLSEVAPPGLTVEVFRGIRNLPIFSTDLEGTNTPATAQAFIDQVDQSDGLIIASPEYVRAIPGGLKNSIDWLVSREAIIDKPTVLIHASHRGDDMLASLRLVLHTVTQRFHEDLFLRIPLMSKTPSEIADILRSEGWAEKVSAFLIKFARFVEDASQGT